MPIDAELARLVRGRAATRRPRRSRSPSDASDVAHPLNGSGFVVPRVEGNGHPGGVVAVVEVAAPRARRPRAAAGVRRRRARPAGARADSDAELVDAVAARAAAAARHHGRAAAHARLPLGARERAARSRSPRAHRGDRARARPASRACSSPAAAFAASAFPTASPTAGDTAGQVAEWLRHMLPRRNARRVAMRIAARCCSSGSGAARPTRSLPALNARPRQAPPRDQGGRHGPARRLGGRRPVPARDGRHRAARTRALEIGAAQRLQRDLDRPGPARDRRPPDDDRVRPGAREAAAANIRRAGLADIVTVVPGDAFEEIPKLAGTFDFVFLDAWKRDYKRFFDLVLPAPRAARPVPRAQRRQQAGARCATSSRRSRTTPALFTTIVTPSGEGMSVSLKIRCRLERLASKSVDSQFKISLCVPSTSSACRSTSAATAAASTWGRRRSASPASASASPRSATPSSTRATCRRRFPKRRSRATSGRSTSARSRRSARSSTRRALASLDEGAMPLVLGGDHSLGAGSVAAAADWAKQTKRPADRPALGRRARRHEHAGDIAERQRARHAARGAARPRAGRAVAASAASRRRCCRRTRCSSASATSTSARRSRCATRACTSSR